MTARAPARERCRVCGNDVPSAARCERCGAPLASLDRCPCCGAESGASPHAELRYACDVCGGPRVPRLDRSVTYGERVAAKLREVDGLRKARAGWHAAAIADGMLLPVVLAVFAALVLIFGAGAGLVVAGLVATAPIAAFLAFAMSRAAARARAMTPALDAAWLAAAGDVARQTPDLTAEILAAKLGVDEQQAEVFLALLDLDGTSPATRVRIEAPAAPQAAASATQHADAEREAMAAEDDAPARARIGKP